MKKLYTPFFFLFLLFGVTQAQNPAGTCIHIDYDDFQTDNIRRYVNCGNSGFLNPGNELTMEAWVRIYDSGWNQKIFGKLNPSFNSGYMMAVDQGKIYPELWNPTGNDLLVGFIPPLGFWVHFATTFTAGDSMIAYVNGVNVGATSVGANGIATNNDDLIIGIAPWDLSNFQYFGDIDEVRIWNEARTEEEIRASMFTEITSPTAALLAYYPFNEGTGTTTADMSSNSNDGTFVGLTTNDWEDSRAVIGNSTVAGWNDLAGMWNGNQFVNPRFALTDNGLSMVSSDITDYDYVVFGHDNGSGTSTSDIPAGTSNFERTDRTWYINAVGDVPADLTFELTEANGGGTALSTTEAVQNYGLLYRSGATGTFSLIGQATSKNGSTVSFDGVDLIDGYYAVGVGDAAVVGIEEVAGGNQLLHVWPNPANGSVNLSFEGWSGAANIQLLNAVGQVVLQREVAALQPASKVQLEVSDFSEGMYYLRLETETGVYTRKLRVE